MTVSAQYAATHLDDILSAVDEGEQVRIDRADKPSIRLIVEKSTERNAAQQAGRRILGAGRGELRVPSIEEWAQMDRELEHLMNDAPLTSQGDR
jgi:antitoxin (DNA-binding transcriptional repressor) of toxin-antitoxin stability system